MEKTINIDMNKTLYKSGDILIFNTDNSDKYYTTFNNQKVKVNRPLTANECDVPDVGFMYRVSLVDSPYTTFIAFQYELSYVSETTKKCMIEFNRNHHALFPNQDGMNWWWNFEYLRFNMNGSITCKASEEALKCLETQSLAIALLWENSLDTQLVGEDGCMGNYDMYTPLYFPNIGLACLVPYSKAEEWKEGKEITLDCYEPTKEEVLEFIEWWTEHE